MSACVMLVAAEASGDLLGADLIAALRRRLGPDTRFVGLGGAAMAAEGVASAFDIRLAKGTTTGATIATTASGTGDKLTYGIQQLPVGTTCTASATSTTVVPAGTALDSAVGAASFTLAQPAGDEAGEAAHLCITVTADSQLEQGMTGKGVWTFTATSN